MNKEIKGEIMMIARTGRNLIVQVTLVAHFGLRHTSNMNLFIVYCLKYV